MTDADRDALHWLGSMDNKAVGAVVQQHVRRLKAMLSARSGPVMPDINPAAVEAIRDALENTSHLGLTQQAAHAFIALRDYLTAPRTKEVEVWRVEWAEQDNVYPPPEHWVPRCKSFSDDKRAYLWMHKHRHVPCIRVTGPHKQTVPA